jgi:outer membrane protein insertion porin family
VGQADDAANPDATIMSGSMLARVIACAITGLVSIAALPGTAGAQTPASQNSASIVIEGNRRVEAATVRSYFETQGGKLDDAALNAGLKKLLATNLFDSAEIKRRGEQIVVRVAEAPLLGKIAFEGNKKIEDKKLVAVVQSKAGGTLQRAMVQADVARLVDVYRGAGRDDVRIVPQTIQHGDRQDLVFSITEGVKTAVKAITFAGNQAFGERQLKAVIKTGESNFLSFLLSNDTYDPDKLEADRESLRRYYLSKGYADVSVPTAVAEYDPAKKGFAVKFGINEGPVYRFGKVDVVSDVPGLQPDDLRRRLVAREGGTFDNTALEKSIDAVTTELAKRGFPFARTELRTRRDAAGGRIGISFIIANGPRTFVERIEIHGNKRTRDYVIRREFDFAEGDPYNKSLIDRAERRLKNLGYFKSVKIENAAGSASDRVVLNVNLEEQNTGDFFVSGGYSTTDGALVEVKVAEHNFAGTGLDLKASGTYGQYARGFDLAANEPFLFGNRISGGADLYYKDTLSSPYQSYDTEIYGATMQLGTPINEQLAMQWRYSIYNQNLTIDPTSLVGTPSWPIQQAAAAGPAWVSAIGDTATYSTLDNNKAPTSGINSQLRQDLAGLGGDVNFIKTTEDFRFYQSLNSDVVSITHAQGGYVTGWGGKQVPLIDMFFGGQQLVRGFAPNGFGPRDLTPGSTMDNVGGSAYWATSQELQSNIPGVPAEYGLKAAAFIDAGSLWGYRGPTAFPGSTQSVQIADTKAIRSSVGAGLVWASPFGNLSVNYAFALTKAPYDVVQPLSFSAGPF